MSSALWRKLPHRFLRMKFERYDELDHEVKRLIVDLASDQKFKCALCSRDSNLIVEHDHEPQEGCGSTYTIYNIRGLVCSRCNWHLMVYEKEASGEYIDWENASSYLSSREYEDYIYTYECRVGSLIETLLEKRIPNYWHRRLILDRFDDWYYEGGQPPLWYRRHKQKEAVKIETPEDFIRGLTAIVKFVGDQIKKDPNYEPPEIFFKLMVRIRPIIDQVTDSGETFSRLCRQEA